MFEDLNKPSGVEDIFSDTDLTPKPNTPPAPVSSVMPSAETVPTKPVFIPPPAPPGRGPLTATHKPASNQGLIIGAVIVVMLVILGAGYWFYLRPWLAERASSNQEPVTTTEPEPTPPDFTAPPNTEPAPVADEDSDGDRLNNQEEYTIGTDPNNPDSDSDGLFDGEEVLIYQTNPLNSDTDGDTFTDGEEVQNNYDPNGPGRLLNLPNGELNFQELDSLLKFIDKETT